MIQYNFLSAMKSGKKAIELDDNNAFSHKWSVYLQSDFIFEFL